MPKKPKKHQFRPKSRWKTPYQKNVPEEEESEDQRVDLDPNDQGKDQYLGHADQTLEIETQNMDSVNNVHQEMEAEIVNESDVLEVDDHNDHTYSLPYQTGVMAPNTVSIRDIEIFELNLEDKQKETSPIMNERCDIDSVPAFQKCGLNTANVHQEREAEIVNQSDALEVDDHNDHPHSSPYQAGVMDPLTFSTRDKEIFELNYEDNQKETSPIMNERCDIDSVPAFQKCGLNTANVHQEREAEIVNQSDALEVDDHNDHPHSSPYQAGVMDPLTVSTRDKEIFELNLEDNQKETSSIMNERCDIDSVPAFQKCGLNTATLDDQQIFRDCIPILTKILPRQWVPVEAVENGGLHIMKLSPGIEKVVQRTIYIDKSFNMWATFGGKVLPPDHSFTTKLNQHTLKTSSAADLAQGLADIVAEYRLYEVCGGVPQLKFKQLWHKYEDCTVDENPFKESRFSRTCRSRKCSISVPQLQRQCKECFKVYKRFSSRAAVKCPNLSPSGRQRTPNKHKPTWCLNTPEKDARIKRFCKYVRNLKRQNERLREKVEKLVAEEAVEVEEDVNDALLESLEEADKNNKLTDFHKLFLQEQLKASSVKGATGMRWHPLMIRFALQLKMCSSVAYATMAKSGFIKLPSARTLFDYTNAMSIKEGIHYEIIEDVAQAVSNSEHEYQRNHSVTFDEVTVCQNLVQRKTTGEVVGYCNLSNVMQEMSDLEKHVQSVAEEVPSEPTKKLPMVKKMLSYMVKGTASGVKAVVASFGVSLLSKEDLHDYTWDVVGHLEMSGIQVVALICDGAAINRSFFSMQPPHSTDSSIVYDTVNPFAPDRVIHFLSDPPHLLKTIRNCLYNSGKKKCRNMKKRGQFLHWSTIVKLFKQKSEQTIKKLFKLTAPCVFLNSYSRMKVAYAARVISNSVAEVLAELKWANTSELCIFEKF